MKSKLVDTVTSNEGLVRLRIFDGDLQVSEAAAELVRMERAQHTETRRRLNDALAENARLRRELAAREVAP